MHTEVLRIPASSLRNKEALKILLEPAAALIKAGECVAFPTETVYGLGALALDPEAIAKIYLAKGRPGDNPIIAHVNNLSDLSHLVMPLGKLEEALIQLFSPGPITYVLKKRDFVPEALTAGLDTVAVRIPSKPIARALIALCGAPIAAPSANISGMPSPTEAEHVYHDLAGSIPLIIDGGPCEVGLESTVLDLSDVQDIKILRPGSVTAERLIRFLESRKDFSPRYEDWRVRLQSGASTEDISKAPKAPGMKYRHYAPKTAVVVLRGETIEEKVATFAELLEQEPTESSLGLYVSDALATKLLEKFSERSLNSITLAFEESEDGSIAAQHFFSALRELDEEDIDLIVVEALPHSEVGAAYMNRLEKASGASQKKLLFVCTGNTCRSPMAEGLFNHFAAQEKLPWQAISAGLAAFPGDEITTLSALVLKEDYGIDLSNHRAQRLNQDIIANADLILCMTEGQAEALRSMAPQASERIFSLAKYLSRYINSETFLDVNDPYGGNEAVYRSSAKQLAHMIKHLTKVIYA